MGLNLCKFGWHDDEVIDESEGVKRTLTDYLKTNGFKEINGTYGSIWKNDAGYAIKEFGWYDDDTIDGCMPYSCKSKVCLKCGRIKLTYNIKPSIKELQRLINKLDKQNNREIKAKELMEKHNE